MRFIPSYDKPEKLSCLKTNLKTNIKGNYNKVAHLYSTPCLSKCMYRFCLVV